MKPAVQLTVMLALTLSAAWAQATLSDAQIALRRGNATEALAIAKGLNRQMPDDLEIYGLIVDAARAIGQTEEAERAAQWMINLRPEDPRGLWRVAALREDFGDLEGAEEMLNECFRRVPPSDRQWRATLMRQMARISRKTDRNEYARRLLEQADKLEKK